VFLQRGQIRPSMWATSEYQSGPVCSIEVGQFRVAKSLKNGAIGGYLAVDCGRP
jgi:hypothetical protein